MLFKHLLEVSSFVTHELLGNLFRVMTHLFLSDIQSRVFIMLTNAIHEANDYVPAATLYQ